ncbi:SAM-dependent methyltransferase [Fodinicola acaciae]|uniref:SAM-dependent methyltransferase n=1 Tax=Fodinicola acaciae TaxID=2681555 RepID=UPI0013D0EE11|nr:SAM-dependent methyltransferase [Fodinicola acaciae]
MPQSDSPTHPEIGRPIIDTDKPSIARAYDFALGGRDNFEVDRQLYNRVAGATGVGPELIRMARINRQWLMRVVRWLARDIGIDQFIELGSGLPASENVHQVAQAENSEAMVIYVDNDPAVIAHGQALLAENGRTHFVAADLRHPDLLLTNEVVLANLDLDRPVAVMHCLTLHGIPDLAEVRGIVDGYVRPLVSGSYVAMTHAFNPHDGSDLDKLAGRAETAARTAFPDIRFRDRAEMMAILDGLELVEPGLTYLLEWWPEGPNLPADLVSKILLGAVGRKP